MELTGSMLHSHQISPTHFWFLLECTWSITCPLILITSPTAILNLPFNSFCYLDTDLALTSDDLHSISLHPLHFPFPVSHPLWWHFYKTLTWRCLYHAFTYIYSPLIEKDIQIKLLIETKPIVSLPWEILHYKISREKLEPEPGFEPRTSVSRGRFEHEVAWEPG